MLVDDVGRARHVPLGAAVPRRGARARGVMEQGVHCGGGGVSVPAALRAALVGHHVAHHDRAGVLVRIRVQRVAARRARVHAELLSALAGPQAVHVQPAAVRSAVLRVVAEPRVEHQGVPEVRYGLRRGYGAVADGEGLRANDEVVGYVVVVPLDHHPARVVDDVVCDRRVERPPRAHRVGAVDADAPVVAPAVRLVAHPVEQHLGVALGVQGRVHLHQRVALRDVVLHVEAVHVHVRVLPEQHAGERAHVAHLVARERAPRGHGRLRDGHERAVVVAAPGRPGEHIDAASEHTRPVHPLEGVVVDRHAAGAAEVYPRRPLEAKHRAVVHQEAEVVVRVRALLVHRQRPHPLRVSEHTLLGAGVVQPKGVPCHAPRALPHVLRGGVQARSEHAHVRQCQALAVVELQRVLQRAARQREAGRVRAPRRDHRELARGRVEVPLLVVVQELELALQEVHAVVLAEVPDRVVNVPDEPVVV
mmetsp:Transcript_14134/g.48716  ORF Transcript_14134/g.48716 Transcript_14134/m.48716 type:complete len:477 (-) Transcript_14134:952-2382(-)